jgi:hypothetical protein
VTSNPFAGAKTVVNAVDGKGLAKSVFVVEAAEIVNPLNLLLQPGQLGKAVTLKEREVIMPELAPNNICNSSALIMYC